MKKLLNIRQEKLLIQKYVTRTLNLINKTELRDQIARILIFRGLYYKNQKRVMLTNSLYLKEQLIKKGIKEYLKRISTLIRRDEVKRTGEKVILEYEKLSKSFSRVIWKYERDSIKLNELNKKKRKYFKYEKIDYIRRFCRSKENLSKEKKDILVTFEKSENENVLKRERSQNEKL